MLILPDQYRNDQPKEKVMVTEGGREVGREKEGITIIIRKLILTLGLHISDLIIIIINISTLTQQ